MRTIQDNLKLKLAPAAGGLGVRAGIIAIGTLPLP